MFTARYELSHDIKQTVSSEGREDRLRCATKSALYWDITQRVMVIPYLPFRPTYRSHP